ncbi:MAG: MarR family winged helix-turn-helix transcriptional regulator [Alphaproteobacteria bacterium]
MARDHQKSVAVRMAVTTRAYRARMGSMLATIGLHAGQENVLKALEQQDGQSMAELAAKLRVQPPTITKMVGRLSSNGHVQRRGSNKDGRRAHVFLTESGSNALAEIDRMLERIDRKALKGISAKDQKKLGRMLRRMARNLSADKPSTPI